MDLQKLGYFMKVAECQHMTKAAGDLHMTQPALSRIISQLESELGAKLFDREGKTLRLNDNGKVVYESAVHMFQELQDMHQRLADLSSGSQGRIVFAISFPTRKSDWTTSAVKEFLTVHPDTEFLQLQMSAAELRQALEDREIDLALSDRPVLGSNISWQELYSERLGVVLSIDHPLAKEPVLGMNDLVNESFLCNDNSALGENITAFLCDQAGFQPKISFRGDYPTLIGEAVAKGRGVAFVTEGAYRYGFSRQGDESWNPQITFRPIREEYCRRVVGLAVLKNRYLPKIIRDFYEDLACYDIQKHRKDLYRSEQ